MSRDPATHQEITVRLAQYAGPEAWQEVAAIAQMIQEQPRKAIELSDDPETFLKQMMLNSKIEYAHPPNAPIARLAVWEAQIGGFGIHTLVEQLQSKQAPYDMQDRPIYRPIQYVWMYLSRCVDFEWHTRDVAEMACAHIEGLVKRLADKRNLLERLRSSPLGSLLHQRGVRNARSQSLWKDLCWLNNAVYVHVSPLLTEQLEDTMNKSNLVNAILVLNCPKCANSHLYALNVQTSTWMGESPIPATPLKFTRLFTCPDTGEDYQVSMYLMQPHGIDYDEIIVRGVAQVHIDIQDLPAPTDFYKRFGLIEKFKSRGIRASDMRIPPEGIEFSGYRILGVYQA